MIRSELADAIWAITLARPDKRNALTPAMLADVRAALESPPAGARALLMLGEGPVFCAGFDLDACRDDPEGALDRLLADLSGAVRAMRALPFGVVVGAHGAAVAGGCALLGGADVVVADRGCKLGYPVVRLGISPAVSAPFLRLGVGDGRARAMQLDPGLISGERAHADGLVGELVDAAGDVRERAHATARTLAGKPGCAIGATRRWLDEVAPADPGIADAALHASRALVGDADSRQRLERVWRSTR